MLHNRNQRSLKHKKEFGSHHSLPPPPYLNSCTLKGQQQARSVLKIVDHSTRWQHQEVFHASGSIPAWLIIIVLPIEKQWLSRYGMFLLLIMCGYCHACNNSVPAESLTGFAHTQKSINNHTFSIMTFFSN